VQQRSSGGAWRTLQGLADFAVVQSYLTTANRWGHQQNRRPASPIQQRRPLDPDHADTSRPRHHLNSYRRWTGTAQPGNCCGRGTTVRPSP